MRLHFPIRLLPALFVLPLCLSAQGSQGLTDPAAAFFEDTQVREVRLYFDDPNWYNTLLAAHRTTEDPYFPCRFQSGDVKLDKIGCRFKGNSSAQRNGIKKPFKLDFNEYVDDANFLGLKKLNLNNFDLQPDFVREKLLHDLGGRYIASLRSVYTRLYVNDAFYGLYLAVEQPDTTMMRARWGASEDGNVYEGEERMGAGGRPTLAWLGADPAPYKTVYILKSNEEQNDFTRLVQFLDILNNTPTAELFAKLETIADTESWMTSMALNNLVVNLDSYLGTAAEYYLYDRTLDGKFIHVQWDHNESFGITGDGTPRLTTPASTDPFWLPTAATGGGGPGGAANNARPLLEKMWAVDEYRRLYLRSLARFLRHDFHPDNIGPRVQTLAELIRPHVAEDPNKAYTTAQFETALNTQVAAIPGVMQFSRDRYTFLRNYLNGQARRTDVRLNELGPAGTDTIRDEAGDADAWVEIHNVGPGPMATSGFTLTDDAATPGKWALPGVTLADGESLVIWLDGETAEGPAHASFRAPAAGGKLYLFASAISSDTPIDTLTVEAVPAGQSLARAGLYGTKWALTGAPTPKAENKFVTPPAAAVSTGTGQLLVNEIMADNDTVFQDPDEAGAFEDWFEVYNPGSEAVDMSGMYITDNPNNPKKWQVGAGVVVPAGGYVVFMADSEAAQGPRHASWSLSADGESVSIYAADGTTLIDTVTFGPQAKDVPIGRLPGAPATWGALQSATPGAANAGPR